MAIFQLTFFPCSVWPCTRHSMPVRNGVCCRAHGRTHIRSHVHNAHKQTCALLSMHRPGHFIYCMHFRSYLWFATTVAPLICGSHLTLCSSVLLNVTNKSIDPQRDTARAIESSARLLWWFFVAFGHHRINLANLVICVDIGSAFVCPGNGTSNFEGGNWRKASLLSPFVPLGLSLQ